jgi:hypothetical protein
MLFERTKLQVVAEPEPSPEQGKVKQAMETLEKLIEETRSARNKAKRISSVAAELASSVSK